jgi:hypothetical protein
VEAIAKPALVPVFSLLMLYYLVKEQDRVKRKNRRNDD